MSPRERVDAAWNRWMAMPSTERSDIVPILFGSLQFHAKQSRGSRALDWCLTEIESALDKMDRTSPSRLAAAAAAGAAMADGK